MFAQPKYDERELLHQVAEGDEKAFNTLFKKHWDKLYNYLSKVTKSPEIAEELSSDVFTKLWLGRSTIERIQNMDGFLFRVGHNKAMDFLKLSARNVRLQRMIIYLTEDTHGTDADTKLLQDEMEGIIREAIEQLSPQRKMIFKMSREESLSHEEIAKRLGLSRQTVKNTMSDTLNRIRDHMRKKDLPVIMILWF